MSEEFPDNVRPPHQATTRVTVEDGKRVWDRWDGTAWVRLDPNDLPPVPRSDLYVPTEGSTPVLPEGYHVVIGPGTYGHTGLLYPEPEAKPWYASRTLWFNVLTLLGVALVAFTQNVEVSKDAAAWVVVVQAVINTLLRMVTSTPLKLNR